MASKRLYNIDYRKKLNDKIQNITDKKILTSIFKIIKNEDHDYTENKSGIFFNLNTLSDNAIKRIEKIVDSIEVKKEKITLNVITESEDDDLSGHKLNNEEKNVLKKLKN